MQSKHLSLKFHLACHSVFNGSKFVRVLQSLRNIYGGLNMLYIAVHRPKRWETYGSAVQSMKGDNLKNGVSPSYHLNMSGWKVIEAHKGLEPPR